MLTWSDPNSTLFAESGVSTGNAAEDQAFGDGAASQSTGAMDSAGDLPGGKQSFSIVFSKGANGS